MMQDYIRTSTYQRAILDNSIDFAGKVTYSYILFQKKTKTIDFYV